MEEQLIKKILPHSAEAEQSVIGAMIMDQEAILTASEMLTCIRKENRWIWLPFRIVFRR